METGIVHLAGTAFLFCGLSPSPSVARTWYILPDGTGDAPTIQAGIDSAVAGDTVEVACGTYFEHDIVVRSGISLVSETGEAACATIDAEAEGRVLYCENLDENTLIQEFTLAGGRP